MNGKEDEFMEKIKLSNGKEIGILGGATSDCFSIGYEKIEDVGEVMCLLTEENLEKISLLNEMGITCAVQQNKYLSEIHINVKDNIATFILSDVDMVAKKLGELETTQTLQDGAIMELAEIAGGM